MVSNPEEIREQGKAAAVAALPAFLRAMADWLEAHPEVRRPTALRILLTNDIRESRDSQDRNALLDFKGEIDCARCKGTGYVESHDTWYEPDTDEDPVAVAGHHLATRGYKSIPSGNHKGNMYVKGDHHVLVHPTGISHAHGTMKKGFVRGDWTHVSHHDASKVAESVVEYDQKDLTDTETARFYPDLGAFTGALEIQCSKAEVCERVQIGTRYVPEQPRREEIRIVEAVPAHEEPLYSYECGNPWTDEEEEQEEEAADAADVA